MFRLFLLSALTSILFMGAVVAAFALAPSTEPLAQYFQRPKPRPPVTCVITTDGQMTCEVKR